MGVDFAILERERCGVLAVAGEEVGEVLFDVVGDEEFGEVGDGLIGVDLVGTDKVGVV